MAQTNAEPVAASRCRSCTSSRRNRGSDGHAMHIRGFERTDLDGIVRLSLRAWEPVFSSIERAMDPEVFHYFFPDWRNDQRNAVVAVLVDKEARIWVCDCDS